MVTSHMLLKPLERMIQGVPTQGLNTAANNHVSDSMYGSVS